MSGINKAIIVGRTGKDPEIRYTAAGKPVATLSIATSEKWRDKQSGEQKEETEWHRVVVFGAPASFVENYVTKGDQLYIEGKIKTRKWQDRDGNDRYTTEIQAREVQKLNAKSEQAKSSGFRDKPAAEPQDEEIPF